MGALPVDMEIKADCIEAGEGSDGRDFARWFRTAASHRARVARRRRWAPRWMLFSISPELHRTRESPFPSTGTRLGSAHVRCSPAQSLQVPKPREGQASREQAHVDAHTGFSWPAASRQGGARAGASGRPQGRTAAVASQTLPPPTRSRTTTTRCRSATHTSTRRRKTSASASAATASKTPSTRLSVRTLAAAEKSGQPPP